MHVVRTERVTEGAAATSFATRQHRGVEGTTMHVVHHLAFPQEAAARDAAELAEMLGWTLEGVSEHGSPFPEWVLRVSEDVVAGDDGSQAVLEGLAREGAGSYVGRDVRPARRHLVGVAS